MRYFAVMILVLAFGTPARAQFLALASLDRLNHQLAGHVVDHTHNHGADRRIFSTVLNQPRDAYIYLPPGYSPAKQYPLLFYFHFSRVDEHAFIGTRAILQLDRMIQEGTFPPVIVVCPDGTITGRNRLNERHSFYMNGIHGRYEDHIIQELIPFVMSRYSIRPEREAHAIMGISGGGFGALSLAIRYRSFFGSVATIAAPANMLYDNCHHDPLEDFHPETYRWKTVYDPNEVVARFYGGLMKIRARYHVEQVFGHDPHEVITRLTSVNPANLITSTDLKPGQIAIYLNEAGRDGYNIDAQIQSFVWLASQRGIAVARDIDETAGHNLRYFHRSHMPAYKWLAGQLLPPTP